MIWGNRLIILLIRLNGSRNRLNAFAYRFFRPLNGLSVSVRFLKSGHICISFEMIARFGCIENIYIWLYASLLSFARVHSLLKSLRF